VKIKRDSTPAPGAQGKSREPKQMFSKTANTNGGGFIKKGKIKTDPGSQKKI